MFCFGNARTRLRRITFQLGAARMSVTTAQTCCLSFGSSPLTIHSTVTFPTRRPSDASSARRLTPTVYRLCRNTRRHDRRLLVSPLRPVPMPPMTTYITPSPNRCGLGPLPTGTCPMAGFACRSLPNCRRIGLADCCRDIADLTDDRVTFKAPGGHQAVRTVRVALLPPHR